MPAENSTVAFSLIIEPGAMGMQRARILNARGTDELGCGSGPTVADAIYNAALRLPQGAKLYAQAATSICADCGAPTRSYTSEDDPGWHAGGECPTPWYKRGGR